MKECKKRYQKDKYNIRQHNFRPLVLAYQLCDVIKKNIYLLWRLFIESSGTYKIRTGKKVVATC